MEIVGRSAMRRSVRTHLTYRPILGDNEQTVRNVQFVHLSKAMTALTASQARIPPDTFNRVAYQGERVRIDRRGAPSVAIIPIEDLELLEFLEDQIDIQDAHKALAEMKAKGEKPVPWDEVKSRLGLWGEKGRKGDAALLRRCFSIAWRSQRNPDRCQSNRDRHARPTQPQALLGGLVSEACEALTRRNKPDFLAPALSRCLSASGVDSFQYTLIILFCVDQTLYSDAVLVWTVRDQVAAETTNGPKADLGIFRLAKFVGRSQAGVLRQLGVGTFHGLAKTLRGREACMFQQVGVVDQEVAPGGGALNGTGHLGGFAVARQLLCFALHGVEVCGRHLAVMTAPLAFVQQSFQTAIEMLVQRKRLTAAGAPKKFGLGSQQVFDELIGACVVSFVYLLLDEVFEGIGKGYVHGRLPQPSVSYHSTHLMACTCGLLVARRREIVCMLGSGRSTLRPYARFVNASLRHFTNGSLSSITDPPTPQNQQHTPRNHRQIRRSVLSSEQGAG